MYRPRFTRVARDSVMSDDSMQSTLGNLDVLVQGDEEEWLYSPSKVTAHDAAGSAMDWLNMNDGTDSCYDTEGEGDDDLSLLLRSAARPPSLMERDGSSGLDDATSSGLLAPGGANALGLRLGGCPSPAPSSIWSIGSRPGSRMRGTPDIGDIGRAVKNDGQMDDTDDLVTSPTIEFKGYELENEAQWKNATDLNSPTKLNFNTNGPSALAQHLLRKNRSVADLKAASGNGSPSRRLARPSMSGANPNTSRTASSSSSSGAGSARVNLTSRFHAAARDATDGDASSTARSPLAQSHAITSEADRHDDHSDIDSNNGTVHNAESATAAAKKEGELADAQAPSSPSSSLLSSLPRTATSGPLSARAEGTFSPASSSSPTSSLIDPEEMNWHLDETVSITSQSSFHSMEGPMMPTTPGSKTPLSPSATAHAHSYGDFGLNHSSSSLSSLSVNSESSGLVTDAWLNSARKASAPPLPTLEDHRKIGSGSAAASSSSSAMTTPTKSSLRSARSVEPRQTPTAPSNNNSNGGEGDGDGDDEAPAPDSPSPMARASPAESGRSTPTTNNIPLQELFAASRTAPSTPGAPATATPRRGHAPSKSGPIGSIRPPNASA
ncbi:hypothetical protein SYNPS1DRAFT_31788, partial [Syncephalis pseudoplumigaleata]